MEPIANLQVSKRIRDQLKILSIRLGLSLKGLVAKILQKFLEETDAKR